jgi:hypothetical protein
MTTPRRPLRVATATPPGLPASGQLELFLADFQALTGLGNTNTIELFDALPLYQLQAYSASTDTPRIEQIEFRKRQITATVKPAGIVRDGRMVYTFAGTREQLVEAVLRKMVSEPGEHVEFVESSSGVRIPSLRTTPAAIRRRLEAIGHGFKLSEVREALEILGNTKFSLTIIDGHETVDLEGENAIIGRSHRTPRADTTGERSREIITLHPLVVKSIVDRTYRQLDWQKFTTLKRPGARWLYARVMHHFTGVQSGGGMFSAPYNIDLETILSSSGMRRYRTAGGVPVIKDNVRQVRLDLGELRDAGVLDQLKPYVERTRKGREKGKRGPERVVGAVWELFVSAETASAIIDTNRRMKKTELR